MAFQVTTTFTLIRKNWRDKNCSGKNGSWLKEAYIRETQDDEHYRMYSHAYHTRQDNMLHTEQEPGEVM